MASVATLTMNPAIDLSAEVEELVPGPKLRSSWHRYEPGGGGINVAQVIHRQKGRTCAVFPAGGPTGDMLCDLLDDAGVAYRPVLIRATTRESVAIHVRSSGDLYHFVMPGAELDEQEAEQCLAALAEIEPVPLYLVASGSLPPGVDEQFYARVAKMCQKRETRLILDTSGAPLRAAVQEALYLVKPNQQEFAELAGEEISADEDGRREQSTRALEATKAEVLVVTLGEEGALLATRSGHIRVRPPKVEVVSPVGAGDSFVALLSLKLAQGRDLKEALCYAVAAAAAAVITPGSELLHGDDLDRLYRQMMENGDSLNDTR